MKIAISTDIYYPMINGVAVFARNLAAGLHKQGHEVIVLAPSTTGKFEMEIDEEYGFKVFRLSSHRMHFYPDQINDIPAQREFLSVKLPQLLYKNGLHVSFAPFNEVRHVLDHFKPDIIHDQTPGPVALSVFRYAKHRNIPLVSTDHAYPDNLTQQVRLPLFILKPINTMMNKYFISFLKRSEYATMPTEQAVMDLIPRNKKRFKVPVEAISNGIDLSRFKNKPAPKAIYDKYKIPKDRKIVLYVGRVDPEKSLHVLVEAFGKVCKKVSDVDLVVVGDGTARNKLEKMAEEGGFADRAHFLGRIVGDDLPKIYRTGTVFAITSKTETQSIVLLEAMASGLPAVAVRAGAIHELVKNNKSGFLCEADDVDAVAKGLTKILNSDELREKLSLGALEIVKKHDINYTLSRMVEIYENVLENRRKA